MEKRLYTTVALLGIAVLVISVQIFSAQTQTVATHNLPEISSEILESVDMIVFVSPQYSQDTEIISSIKNYVDNVKLDIGYNCIIITINSEENDFIKIDQVIEQYYQQYNIKACMMVGEDIDTALSGDSDYMEKPSVIPWCTVGGKSAYNLSVSGIVCKPYTAKICVSLMYPTHSFDYQTKKNQLISAFVKFSERKQYKLQDILVAESSDINKNSKNIYNNLEDVATLSYFEDISEENLKIIFEKSYSSVFIHGHSNPSGTVINAKDETWFSADFIDQIETPIFGADGCYVNGWWSIEEDNNHLDSSINYTWYGNKIFTSEHVQVMALGLLSQTGYSHPVGFLETIFPGISQAKTVAESIINHPCLGDTVIVGDPTFHFSY